MNNVVTVVKLKIGGNAQKVHICFQQRTYRADVLPIAFKAVREHLLACVEHCGQNVFAEIIFGIRIFLIQLEILIKLVRAEDIYAHRCQVALGLLGFFLELIYRAVGIGI